MMTMATSHLSAEVLSDWNRLGDGRDAPAYRTRAVGEMRAGTYGAPCAISRLAEGPGTNVDAIAKRKTRDENKDRPPARHICHATWGHLSTVRSCRRRSSPPARRSRPCSCGRPLPSVRPR
ncbi:hypothetical protein BC826DRAFT_1185256 [Russula brevipes]|nr:hypothetical protein BC826DRAFT_1185256 [Russula brevipes]